MKVLSRRMLPTVAAALAVSAFAVPAASASASTSTHHDLPAGVRNAVFVMTDSTAGNAVVAYQRTSRGTLTPAGTYPTGGLGGQLPGSVVDHTASQGALRYNAEHNLLLAVNPGSDSLSVFAVSGDRLKLRQVITSGGAFPVSVSVHGNQAYVLDALGGGALFGYRISDGRLSPIPGSLRPLGLGTTSASQFTATPGQVAFTPDGSAVLVTTKGTGNDVDVFLVGKDGLLSAAPTVNAEPGASPFAIAFDRFGHVLVAESGPSALATFALSGGVLTQLAVTSTGQAATCWVTPAGRFFYTSNAGSGSVSGFLTGAGGSLTSLGNTATHAGTVDATATPSGRFLYVQTGAAGIVDEFAVGLGGALTPLGSVTVPSAAGGEGIAAT